MEAVLLVDFGSTYTKVSVVDIANEEILGTSKSFTTIETDINEGFENAVSLLTNDIGEIEFNDVFACSSAAGGLKMVAVGLVPELTAEAAKRAALSAGAKVLKTFAFELNDSEIKEIEELKPDILLLTGGTDGGNYKTILHNAKKLSNLKREFPIIIAGNKSCQDEVHKILSEKRENTILIDNVMPSLNALNIEPARACIRKVFLEKIIDAKGLSKIKELINNIIMPTPTAVLNAATLLANGTDNEKGMDELIVIDVGGATTDVHSIAEGMPTKSNIIFKGLEEPIAKRTVEGDLGMRYSSKALAEAVGIKKLCDISKLSEEQVQNYLHLFRNHPESLAADDENIEKMDFAIASTAIEESISRHTGHITMHYSPFGKVFEQEGKDLTGIKTIIGTGGSIINSNNAKEILENASFDDTSPMVLKPMKFDTWLDKDYILAAMGLLAEKYPDIAIRIMKNKIIKL